MSYVASGVRRALHMHAWICYDMDVGIKDLTNGRLDYTCNHLMGAAPTTLCRHNIFYSVFSVLRTMI